MWDAPWKHLLWAFIITHVREPHDYAKHRVMHPWRMRGVWDGGKFLYRHVHSLHHKSYNTTAFSGTSMHPVEATTYYSAAFLCIPFGVHPLVPVAFIIDMFFAAWLGHGGFVFPGTGDYFHNIHHFVFDCNYGTQNVGLDYLFGTFAAREEDVKKIWRKAAPGQKVGLEGNETGCFNISDTKKAQ